MEFLDIIDDNDDVIGSASRDEIYEKRLLHRIVHVFVFRGDKMALQLRSEEASYLPLHWCTAAAGHVSAGETCEEAALRELEEETKVRLPIEFLGNFFVSDIGIKKLLVSFTANFDGDLEAGDKVKKIKFF